MDEIPMKDMFMGFDNCRLSADGGMPEYLFMVFWQKKCKTFLGNMSHVDQSFCSFVQQPDLGNGWMYVNENGQIFVKNVGFMKMRRLNSLKRVREKLIEGLSFSMVLDGILCRAWRGHFVCITSGTNIKPLQRAAKSLEPNAAKALGNIERGDPFPSLSLSFDASDPFLFQDALCLHLLFSDLMAFSDSSSGRNSLIPSFLYSSSSKTLPLHRMLHSTAAVAAPSASPANLDPRSRGLMIPSPSEPGKIELYSPAFYAACTAGGILSCGLTHMAVTPLDLVKCNMQIDPAKYKNISSGFGVLLKEQGFRGFFRGWVPTLLGYSAQGACKFGFYEFFKKYYSDIAGPEYASKYKTLIYLAGSASAEVIADVALCPFEAVKVRVQTQPGFARGLADGLPKFVKSEGTLGLYKGIVPLWGRQIPYTMMKFASFETIVELIYKHAIPTPKNECTKSLQLGVSFAGGYVAGVLCAIVSHPADNLVSFLNNAKGATVGDAVKKLGLWGLFTRGLPLRIVMIGTLTGAQWGIYDAFKVFVGLPTTGGPAPAAAPAPGSELAKA
ncbi:unnamed protein product [Sphenostylis stenocarpa]|uniref:Uncharacterized protein n=1 Tax=Sphenostylis stenocarpa TaxID=92480 RepID=A0AA86V0Z2_9FABA|nr:unnamed protein product [Sphenostylis stenocarpa]